MEADKAFCVINVYAGHSSNSRPIHEELPAIDAGDGSYKLLASPGLALNLAKNDVVRIDEIDRPATVLKRGGNFCIQIYADTIPPDEIKKLEDDVQRELGGSLDGINGGNLALSVPSANGFHAINRLFDEFQSRTAVQWYYGNIYRNFEDPVDETLLDWWNEG
jgi:hypothetical protein